ncbi:hypothetical protein AVEN_59135-1 [Araneus ventricosus]|uniref:Uncharacterized protein n=1 Tax=Araneus ventricosus TaxID=182803 RepID=A0A4Y2IGI0_ARAVE|nr:hypothetical protein AVEN_59135-1 [Araneus ventricosus]
MAPSRYVDLPQTSGDGIGRDKLDPTLIYIHRNYRDSAYRPCSSSSYPSFWGGGINFARVFYPSITSAVYYKPTPVQLDSPEQELHSPSTCASDSPLAGLLLLDSFMRLPHSCLPDSPLSRATHCTQTHLSRDFTLPSRLPKAETHSPSSRLT